MDELVVWHDSPLLTRPSAQVRHALTMTFEGVML
jgi:hypothetical protein